MVVEWLNASLTIYKNREDIGTALDSGLSAFLGKKTVIAITGMAGVGKTVLLDHLTGEAFKAGYQVPHQSQRRESAMLKAGSKRLKIVVVPGQDSTPKHLTMKDLFEKGSVDGVIHVVANGLGTTRTTGAIEVLKKARIDNLDKYRKYKLKEEIEDLEETCHFIRDNHHRKRKPTWLIVAVDKVDLYQATIQEVRDYYSPIGVNKFGKTIRAMVNQIGSRHIRWDDTVPVCSQLDEFKWGLHSLVPQINGDDRNAYLIQFLELLKSYCA